MLITLVLAFFVFVVALAAPRRRHLLLASVIVVEVLVPARLDNSAAGVLGAGGTMLLAIVMAEFFRDPRKFGSWLGRYPALIAAAAGLSLYMVVVTWAEQASLSTAFVHVLNGVLLPVGFFVLLAVVLIDEPEKSQFFIAVLSILVTFQACLAWAQYLTGSALLWGDFFSQQWWWLGYDLNQPVGTFGHWIPMSTFIGASIPLIWELRPPFLRVVLIPLAISAVVLSASRAGFLLVAISLVFIGLATLSSRQIGAILGGVVSLGIVGSFVANYLESSYAQNLLNRFEDDKGSSDLRLQASVWFWDNAHLFVYSRYPGDTNFRENGTLRSSLENSYYFFAVEFGLIPTFFLVLVLGAAVAAVFFRGKSLRTHALGFLIGILVAFGTAGLFGTGDLTFILLFWFGVAMGLYGLSRRGQREAQHQQDDGGTAVSDESLPVGSFWRP